MVGHGVGACSGGGGAPRRRRLQRGLLRGRLPLQRLPKLPLHPHPHPPPACTTASPPPGPTLHFAPSGASQGVALVMPDIIGGSRRYSGTKIRFRRSWLRALLHARHPQPGIL